VFGIRNFKLLCFYLIKGECIQVDGEDMDITHR